MAKFLPTGTPIGQQRDGVGMRDSNRAHRADFSSQQFDTLLKFSSEHAGFDHVFIMIE